MTARVAKIAARCFIDLTTHATAMTTSAIRPMLA